MEFYTSMYGLYRKEVDITQPLHLTEFERNKIMSEGILIDLVPPKGRTGYVPEHPIWSPNNGKPDEEWPLSGEDMSRKAEEIARKVADSMPADFPMTQKIKVTRTPMMLNGRGDPVMPNLKALRPIQRDIEITRFNMYPHFEDISDAEEEGEENQDPRNNKKNEWKGNVPEDFDPDQFLNR